MQDSTADDDAKGPMAEDELCNIMDMDCALTSDNPNTILKSVSLWPLMSLSLFMRSSPAVRSTAFRLRLVCLRAMVGNVCLHVPITTLANHKRS